jgi:hypothetical protein
VSRKFVRRVALSVLFVLLPLRSSLVLAQDSQPPCTELPANIVVGEFLKPTVSTLLRKSPTFRHQCEVIGATRRVRVILVAVPAPRESTAPRAKATFTRYSFGLLRAEIEVPVTADHSELIAHEFEHVLEQIEGLDLVTLARDGDDRVVTVGAGLFETRRAQTAGRLAAEEVRGTDTDPAVTSAIQGIVRVWRGLAARAARDPRVGILNR